MIMHVLLPGSNTHLQEQSVLVSSVHGGLPVELTSLLIVFGQDLQDGTAADAKSASDARAADGPRDDQIDSRRSPEARVAAVIQCGPFHDPVILLLVDDRDRV